MRRSIRARRENGQGKLHQNSRAKPAWTVYDGDAMVDRVEREIEEILARLETELPRETAAAPERRPISISSAREVRTQRAKSASRKPRRQLPFEPATLLFSGAIVMVAGLILASAVASPFIWLSFAGVVVFIAAFAWSFFRTPTPGPMGGGSTTTSEPGKVFWRDRYINANPSGGSATEKLRRRFRR